MVAEKWSNCFPKQQIKTRSRVHVRAQVGPAELAHQIDDSNGRSCLQPTTLKRVRLLRFLKRDC